MTNTIVGLIVEAHTTGLGDAGEPYYLAAVVNDADDGADRLVLADGTERLVIADRNPERRVGLSAALDSDERDRGNATRTRCSRCSARLSVTDRPTSRAATHRTNRPATVTTMRLRRF
jgi:hypothetical protein